MINFDGKELQEEFNRAFGVCTISKVKETSEGHQFNTTEILSINTLTIEQLWWLVKFAKHVRGRCRSNVAFNNYMNRNFPHARFENVLKEYSGRAYQGLKITVNGEIMEGEDNE